MKSWFANTSMFTSEGWVYFTLMDGRGLVELLSFENGVWDRDGMTGHFLDRQYVNSRASPRDVTGASSEDSNSDSPECPCG